MEIFKTRKAEVIKKLLDDGVDPDQVNWMGKTLLQVTSTFKVAKLLIDAGADVNVKIGGWTPLHQAVDKNGIKWVKYLLEHGANVNSRYTTNLLELTTNVKIAKLLVEYGIDVSNVRVTSIMSGNYDYYLDLVEIGAIEPHIDSWKYIENMDQLMGTDELGINIATSPGIFSKIASCNYIEWARYLLDQGYRSIGAAQFARSYEMFKLLRQDDDVVPNGVLCELIRDNELDMVDEIIGSGKCNLDGCIENVRSVEMANLLRKHGKGLYGVYNEVVIRLLQEEKYDEMINFLNQGYQVGPVTMHGIPDLVIRELMGCGVVMDLASLEYYVKEDNLEMVRYGLEHGQTRGNSIWVYVKSVEMCELLDQYNVYKPQNMLELVNYSSNYGVNPIFLAYFMRNKPQKHLNLVLFMSCNIELSQELIKLGANMHGMINDVPIVVFHLRWYHDHQMEYFEWLIKQGVNLSQCSVSGKNALDCATHLQIKMLLDAGAFLPGKFRMNKHRQLLRDGYQVMTKGEFVLMLWRFQVWWQTRAGEGRDVENYGKVMNSMGQGVWQLISGIATLPECVSRYVFEFV